MKAADIKHFDLVVVREEDGIPFIGNNTGDVGVQDELKFKDGSIGFGFFDNQIGRHIKLSDCEKIPEKFLSFDKRDWLYLVRYGKTRKQIIEG